VHSRFDVATLPADAVGSRARSGRLSGLVLSIALRTALRLIAVFA
jgi:hypothetical protein